ncbi:VOC family protein [Gordonia sp. LUNF6]|uniref:VOC family protein n=1 Tax=Gordonia sp. LUNF6 TaxID=3388658 RepID=UPI003999786A
MHVRWLTAFFDFPASEFGAEVTFWRAISGSTVSPPRGEFKEFATLEPFHGDPYLRVQRVDGGPGGMHLDLHVDDPSQAMLEAESRGATVESVADGVVTMRSPAGGVFCLIPWRNESVRARPIRWPGGGISIIDQLRFQVPSADFGTEVQFWAGLTGKDAGPTEGVDAVALNNSPRLSLQVVIMRTDESIASAHTAIAATNVPDEVERHEGWGATVVARSADCVQMADPCGRLYCITARNPRTGV